MWFANDISVLASDPYYFADGSYAKASVTVPQGSRNLDVYDNLNGSVNLYWGVLTVPADSYNVYVNGVLRQNVLNSGLPGSLTYTVTGLQIASYDGSVKTPALNYDFKVVAVFNGAEVVATLDTIVTPNPTSVMLVTSMPRLFPFPNTGLN